VIVRRYAEYAMAGAVVAVAGVSAAQIAQRRAAAIVFGAGGILALLIGAGSITRRVDLSRDVMVWGTAFAVAWLAFASSSAWSTSETVQITAIHVEPIVVRLGCAFTLFGFTGAVLTVWSRPTRRGSDKALAALIAALGAVVAVLTACVVATVVTYVVYGWLAHSSNATLARPIAAGVFGAMGVVIAVGVGRAIFFSVLPDRKWEA